MPIKNLIVSTKTKNFFKITAKQRLVRNLAYIVRFLFPFMPSEKGYKIISCIKTTSQENKIVRFLRTCYYKLIKNL